MTKFTKSSITSTVVTKLLRKYTEAMRVLHVLPKLFDGSDVTIAGTGELGLSGSPLQVIAITSVIDKCAIAILDTYFSNMIVFQSE